ncbi:hypothetical protein F1880_000603 [Penicillium rolfsii]|nr:hypothetical protein F1880_000603 [Penicillium rolfsii]
MARIKKGVFSWEDVLAHRYQCVTLPIQNAFQSRNNTECRPPDLSFTEHKHNKPPPLAHLRPACSPHTPQSQPQCALLTRLSPELRLIIWEMVLGGHRLHIIQRSGQRLGHVICPLCPGGEGRAENRSSSSFGPRPRTDFPRKINVARDQRDTICEICQGVGIAQPVKEGDSWGSGCAGRTGNGLLALALTCRQISIESIHLLYTKNTFEFSNPWSLPYLQPTIPPEYWNCIRAVELRWSFPGHWLPTKEPVRAIYVAAGRTQWLETCDAVKQLPALRSFTLVLGSSWFREPVEKLAVFLEPLGGFRTAKGSRRGYKPAETEGEVDLMEWRRGSRGSSLDEMSLSLTESNSGSSRSMESSTSILGSEESEFESPCSGFDSDLMGVGKSDAGVDIAVDGGSAPWELRLQGQSYYEHEVGQIGNDLWQKGIDCWISTV